MTDFVLGQFQRASSFFTDAAKRLYVALWGCACKTHLNVS